MNRKLKHPEYCDGCDQLKKLMTLAQHSKCSKYQIVMLPKSDLLLTSRGNFQFPRPGKCKDEDE